MIKKIILTVLIGFLITFLVILFLTFNKVFNSSRGRPNPLYKRSLIDLRYRYPSGDVIHDVEELKLIDGRWLVKTTTSQGEFLPLDKNRLNNLISKLTEVKKLEIISTNVGFLSRFGLDDKSRVEVEIKVKGDSKPIHLYLGKVAADFQNTYISFSPKGPVLLFPSDRFLLLPSHIELSNPLSAYLNSLQDVKKIEIMVGKNKVEIIHNQKDDSWLTMDKKKIDIAQVEAWFENLKDFQSKSIKKTTAVKLDKGEQVVEIEFYLTTGRLKIDVFKTPRADYWLGVASYPNYLWSVDKITFKKMEELAK